MPQPPHPVSGCPTPFPQCWSPHPGKHWFGGCSTHGSDPATHWGWQPPPARLAWPAPARLPFPQHQAQILNTSQHSLQKPDPLPQPTPWGPADVPADFGKPSETQTPSPRLPHRSCSRLTRVVPWPHFSPSRHPAGVIALTPGSISGVAPRTGWWLPALRCRFPSRPRAELPSLRRGCLPPSPLGTVAPGLSSPLPTKPMCKSPCRAEAGSELLAGVCYVARTAPESPGHRGQD